MAIAVETKQIEVNVIRCTWRVQIFFCDLDTDYTIEFFRETVYKDVETGEIVKQVPDAQPLRKRVSQCEPGSLELTIAAQLSEIADLWDVTPPTPPEPEPNPEPEHEA